MNLFFKWITVMGMMGLACQKTAPTDQQIDNIEHKKIVAIGDIHADATAAIEIFRLAGITDEQGNWAAKDLIVVQTGDITDRGPD